jgi:hypothetical protein
VGPDSVLGKTQKGNREIETRENKLDHRLRALLIMVNGRATAAELGKKFEQIGDIGSMLQQLVAQGFVEVVGGAGTPATAASPAAAPAAGANAAPPSLKQVQVAICTQLRNMLGPDADMITEKIEDCSSLPDLRAYLNGQREMLNEWLGKSKSAQFWAKADPLLR